jgi:hypothetical protein
MRANGKRHRLAAGGAQVIDQPGGTINQVNSQPPKLAQAPRKNQSLRCPICEGTFRRRARQQRYCSPKCMRKANYVRRAGSGLLLGQDTALVRNPPKSSHDFNELKRAKTRSSSSIIGPQKVIQAEIIAGREWQEVISANGVTSYVGRITGRALIEGGAL